tara:strand:- start:1264 stop:1485 length:222 start_codon:yes stop_codon:yes gene_type:complete
MKTYIAKPSYLRAHTEIFTDPYEAIAYLEKECAQSSVSRSLSSPKTKLRRMLEEWTWIDKLKIVEVPDEAPKD